MAWDLEVTESDGDRPVLHHYPAEGLVRLADHHSLESEVRLCAGDAPANAQHQTEADPLECRPHLHRRRRSRVVANATDWQANDGDVLATYRFQGVRVLVVAAGLVLQADVLFVEHLLRGCKLGREGAQPPDGVLVAE